MNSSTNIDELADAFAARLASIGFDMPGSSGGTLGDDCANAIAASIAEDAAKGIGADGQQFPENSEPYRTDKQKKFGTDKPGFRTGQMLSLESLKGGVAISRDEVVMTYGTGEAPAVAGGGEATDQEKLGYLAEKFGPIFAMNEARDAKVTTLVGDAIGRHFSWG